MTTHGWQALLPQGHPMVLVDRVLKLEPAGSITAIKAITLAEPCYAGLSAHLPAMRFAYPPAMILESFCQAAAILWLSARDTQEDWVVLLGYARDCRFERSAFPGDTLRHEARVEKVLGQAVIASGQTWVEGERVATFGSVAATVRPGHFLEERVPTLAANSAE